MTNLESRFSHIKKLIEKGYLEEALSKSIKLSKDLRKKRNSFTQLSSRFATFNDDKDSGILSQDQIALQRSRISKDLISLLGKLEKKTSSPNRTFSLYLIWFLGLGGLIILTIHINNTRNQIIISEVPFPDELQDYGFTKTYLANSLNSELVKNVQKGQEKLKSIYSNQSSEIDSARSLTLDLLEENGWRDQNLTDYQWFTWKSGKYLRNLFGKSDIILSPFVTKFGSSYSLNLVISTSLRSIREHTIYLGPQIDSINFNSATQHIVFQTLAEFNPLYAVLMDYYDPEEYSYEGNSSNWINKFSTVDQKIDLLKKEEIKKMYGPYLSSQNYIKKNQIEVLKMVIKSIYLH